MPLPMTSTFIPDGERRAPVADQGPRGQTCKEIARHSKHDADAYDAYSHDMGKVSRRSSR